MVSLQFILDTMIKFNKSLSKIISDLEESSPILKNSLLEISPVNFCINIIRSDFKMFIKPEKFDFRVTTQNAELWSFQIADKLISYTWDNKKPTAQMLGRWQPWHAGHQKLFEEILKKTGQVNIMVRDVKGVDDNPFDFETVKKNILDALKDYKNRIQVTLVPNITNICYGRGVGYKIEEIVLDEKTQQISATKIREQMRKEGKLK